MESRSRDNVVTVRLSESEKKRLGYIKEYFEAMEVLPETTNSNVIRYILNSFFDSLKGEIKKRRAGHERRQ
ncbi:MAG: hypothetical protein QMD22_10500 [archaeon]|nr:hypothetical protein [archaeon]